MYNTINRYCEKQNSLNDHPGRFQFVINVIMFVYHKYWTMTICKCQYICNTSKCEAYLSDILPVVFIVCKLVVLSLFCSYFFRHEDALNTTLYIEQQLINLPYETLFGLDRCKASFATLLFSPN